MAQAQRRNSPLSTIQKRRRHSLDGILANTVPGAVGAIRSCSAESTEHASIPNCSTEAIEAAREGHPLDLPWCAANHNASISKLSSVSIFRKGPAEETEALSSREIYSAQPDLARSLEIISREGADAFYRGKLARLTADFYEKSGGLLRYEDLRLVSAGRRVADSHGLQGIRRLSIGAEFARYRACFRR